MTTVRHHVIVTSTRVTTSKVTAAVPVHRSERVPVPEVIERNHLSVVVVVLVADVALSIPSGCLLLLLLLMWLLMMRRSGGVKCALSLWGQWSEPTPVQVVLVGRDFAHWRSRGGVI